MSGRGARVALGVLAACAIVGGAAALTTALVAAGDDPSADATSALGAGGSGSPTRPVDPRARARFVVECPWSHRATHDPIVYPGSTSRSHLHDFFGNTSTDEDSTAETLARADTTCHQQLDRAAYWAPALLDPAGEPVEPVASAAYYRVGPGTPADAVEPFPFGLMMIGGDAHAPGPQDPAIVGWHCGQSPVEAPTPVACPEGVHLRLRVTFPSCWDGDALDSDDHRSHMAYADDAGCPDSHPVAVPELTFEVEYPVAGDMTGYTLASGAPDTGHADFVNAWDPEKLATEVDACLHRDVVCTVTDGGD